MININAKILFNIFGIFFYLVVIVVSIGRRGIRDRISQNLNAYLGVSLLIEILILAKMVDQPLILPDYFFPNLHFYGILLRSILIFHLGVLFYRRKAIWFWWAAGVIFLAVGTVLENIWFSAPYIIKISPYWVVDGFSVFTTTIITGWGIFLARTFWRTVRAYQREELFITKSRIRYWALGLTLVCISDILIITQRTFAGGVFQYSGVLVIAFIVLTTRLPDIKSGFRQFISIISAAILGIGIYTGGFLILQVIVKDFSGYNPLFTSLGLGIIFVLLFNPVLWLVKKGVNRLLYGAQKDYSLVLRAYSKGISSVLDLNMLSKVVLESIGEWIEIDRGTLFSIDSEIGENGERLYRLTGIHEPGSEKPPGILSFDSPIVKSFIQDRKHLTISDFEMLPEYQGLDREERSWFEALKVEIFIPILAMDEWVGLLALGQQLSGAWYSKRDISLLETLADQSAVAMQNARLVESLVRINNEFRRAYSAMEDAHSKLEKLERSKSDFISISSHELRTPLTVLSGYSQILMEDPTFTDNEYYQRVIRGLYDGTNRLHEIVDSMLELAKIDTRALELQAESIRVLDLIHQVSVDFKEDVRVRNLDISFDSLDDLPFIWGDPEALKKIFFHLLSNAIKFTPDGGKITISGSVIPEGDERFPAGGVEVVVSDTGIGIDPRFNELIFTKFYQTGELALHSTGKTKFKGGGPGLGLAIVQGIVQAHGGRVWAESAGYDEEKNLGSDFHVVLPVSTET